MRGAMDTFWRLLEESVIVQSSVTLIAVCITSYMVVTNPKEVPKEWWTVMGIIIGFWFGSKVQIASRSARIDERKKVAEAAKEACCE